LLHHLFTVPLFTEQPIISKALGSEPKLKQFWMAGPGQEM